MATAPRPPGTKVKKLKPGVLFGGAFGGVLPVVAHTASSLTAAAGSPAPSAGFFVGLTLLALIGMVFAWAMPRPDDSFRDHLFRGIAAPAVISQLASGIQVGPQNSLGSLVPSSHAATLERPEFQVAQAGTTETRQITVNWLVQPSTLRTSAKTITFSKKFYNEMIPIFTVSLADGIASFPIPTETAVVGFDVDNSKSDSHSGGFLVPDHSKLPVPAVTLIINLEPTFFGDLTWSLGAQRTGEIAGITKYLKYQY